LICDLRFAIEGEVNRRGFNRKSQIQNRKSNHPFTFAPHFGHVPSARAVCTPGHIGQSSWAAVMALLLLALLLAGWVVAFFESHGM
jgi:hypothetical protein